MQLKVTSKQMSEADINSISDFVMNYIKLFGTYATMETMIGDGVGKIRVRLSKPCQELTTALTKLFNCYKWVKTPNSNF